MSVKNLVCIENGYHYLGTATLNKNESSLSLLHTNKQECVVFQTTIIETIKRIVNPEDLMAFYSNDSYSFIFTKQGIVSGNVKEATNEIANCLNESYKIAIAGVEKREQELKKLFPYFNYQQAYQTELKNRQEEISKLYDIQKAILSGEKIVNAKMFLDFYDIFMETVEPIKSASYEKKLQKLLKEYSND